jgi:ribosomal protein S27AE
MFFGPLASDWSRATVTFLSSGALPLPEMSTETISRESMLRAGDLILQRVAEYREKAKGLYYEVMLFQKECPSCGNSALVMTQDSRCQCRHCEAELDPTVQFQTCPDCDQRLILKTYHYWCPGCRRPVHSLFCFDERVFNNEYFREMMRESRERRKEEIEKLRNLLLDTRSPPYWPEAEPLLEDAAQFERDLEGFVAPMPIAETTDVSSRPCFDLQVYRRHLLDRVQGCVVRFEGVSALVHQVGSEGKAPVIAFQIESVRGAGHRGQQEHFEQADIEPKKDSQ